MISVSPVFIKKKICFWYVFIMMNCRCFYSSTDVSGTDPLLIELLIVPDYVQYRTSFAVSHGREILPSEFQRCFSRDRKWGVGVAKKDFTSLGILKTDYRSSAELRSEQNKCRCRLILHKWHEWRESKSEPSYLGRNSHGAKRGEGPQNATESRFRIWSWNSFPTVFYQRALIWVRWYATLRSHTRDSNIDLPRLSDYRHAGKRWTSWRSPQIQCTVCCLLYRTADKHCRHSSSFLSVLSEKSACGYRLSLFKSLDQNEQTRFRSEAKQVKPSFFSLVNQELLRSYQSWTNSV